MQLMRLLRCQALMRCLSAPMIYRTAYSYAAILVIHGCWRRSPKQNACATQNTCQLEFFAMIQKLRHCASKKVFACSPWEPTSRSFVQKFKKCLLRWADMTTSHEFASIT